MTKAAPGKWTSMFTLDSEMGNSSEGNCSGAFWKQKPKQLTGAIQDCQRRNGYTPKGPRVSGRGRKRADNPWRLQGCAGSLASFPTCLQEEADLLHQIKQALLSLVQGASDGDGEPFLDCLGVALEEELGGRAVLGMDRVLEGLGQKDGGGADGTVWAGRRKTACSTLPPRDPFPFWEDNVEIESDLASRPLPGHRKDRSLSTSRHRFTGKAPRSPLR